MDPPYLVLNPVFSMFKTPPVWYEYERVVEDGFVKFKSKPTYELKVYGCLQDEYLKKVISLR